MTTTPTPAEFLALTDPEDDVDDEPVTADPLVSIADSLRRIAAGCTGATFFEAELQSTDDNELQERYDRLDQEYADLEDKQRSLYELLAEVEKITKPSTSKLANSVREAINRWRNPEVPPEDPEPASETCVCGATLGSRECELRAHLYGPQSATPPEQPAHDADVEEWRAYAGNRGYTLPYVETMNRSQIRTMLGIEQPVEDPA